MKPLISVIIPAYNVETYIERGIQSVCEQTYQDLEIIVVDDGSTDHTGKIVDELAQKDKRIVVIHKKNGGVSAARNDGIDHAHGEYIGFVDGDDTIAPDMYEFLLQNAQKYQADISHCGYQMVFPDRRDNYYGTGKIIEQTRETGVQDLLMGTMVEPGLCNKLYKRSLFHDIKLNTKIKINEDLLANYYLFKKAEKAVFEDQMKYYYMVRKNSASTSQNARHIQDPIAVWQEIIRQEEGRTLEIAMRRYLMVLRDFIVKSKRDISSELWKFQGEMKEELLQKYLICKDIFSKREQKQMELAIKLPAIYRKIHAVYGTVTGSKDKYKVK